MRVKVEVTVNDIVYGARGLPSSCPVALATNRATGCESTVCTNITTIYRDNRSYRPLATIVNGSAVRGFIQLFDRGDTPLPFTFEIELPEGVCVSK